jgi:hypothetical protein
VAQYRPLRTRTDDFSVGADYAYSFLRFGLTQTVRVSSVEDERFYDVRRPDGVDPISQTLRRDSRATAWTTVGKAGATFLDGKLDVNLFLTWTRMPLRSDVDVETLGYDTGRLDMTNVNGAFVQTTSGSTELDRRATGTRIESSWRPSTEIEVVGAAETEDVSDTGRLRLHRRRDFVRPELDPVVRDTVFDPRIVESARRLSLEATWQVSERVRLRLGEQFLRQVLCVPTQTHFKFRPPIQSQGVVFDGSFVDDLQPRELRSDSWRTTAGVDFEPDSRTSIGLLAHWQTDDAPHTTPVHHVGDDVTLRGRWRASDTWTLSSVFRHKEGENRAGVPYEPTNLAAGDIVRLDLQDRFLRSKTRSDTASISAAYATEGFGAASSLTYRNFSTRSETSHFASGDVVFPAVRFRGDDLTVHVDLHCDVTKSLRLHAGATHTTARGDFHATWLDAVLGARYDLPGRENVTLGLDFFAWRLREKDAPREDYSTQAVEFSIAYKF